MANMFQKLTKREVKGRIGETIWPLLASAGFSRKKKSGWPIYRVATDRIEVIDYLFADAKGYVPWGYSKLSVQLGIGTFICGIPHPLDAKYEGLGGQPVKGSGDCHFRLYIQPPRYLAGWRKSDFWNVDQFGLLLDAVARDAESKTRKVILPWFARFDNLNEILDDFLEDPYFRRFMHWHTQCMHSLALVRGFLAYRLGRWKDAERHLEMAASAVLGGRHAAQSAALPKLYREQMKEIEELLSDVRARSKQLPGK